MASYYHFTAICLQLLICYQLVAVGKASNLANITLGSTLSASAKSNSSWLSPSGHFAFGLYQEGDGFKVGIWLMSVYGNITTWTANRDDPPVSSEATIVMRSDGLILRSGNSVAAITHSASLATHASMLDSGNFVLYNKKDKIWESFRFPTDTLLGGQTLEIGAELFSSKSPNDHSTGRFRLKMQPDGNLVSYRVHTHDTPIDASWASDTWLKPGLNLHLNYSTGDLVLINATSSRPYTTLHSSQLPYNRSVAYRAVLDYNGLFSFSSHVFNETSGGESTTTSESEWSVPDGQCKVKGFCGFNSYCTQDDAVAVCRCVPGTDFVDQNVGTKGCVRNFTDEFCDDATFKSNASSTNNIIFMENMNWDDRPYFVSRMGKEDCRRSCLEDCNCDAALFIFDSSNCLKHKLPLVYARRVLTEQISAFFKVGTKGFEGENTSSITYDRNRERPTIKVSSKQTTILLLVVALGLVTCSCIALVIAGIFVFKRRVFEYKKLLENPGLGDELTIRSFSYNELKKATNGFKEELGKGSFGAVYKGTLYRGTRIVAVKRLEKLVDDGEREFRAEMQVIGRTHHKNLVRLLGYCAEESKRLLVYEYMSNGSLADILFRAEKRRLEWTDRVRVALDVARGILYLHEKCQTPIIHCDIKPQNILMDEFGTAKISDFGLAKLLMPDQTRTFTIVRGTRGYLAPEWNKNVPISVKADIYSFGVMLLEIVSCRRNIEVKVSTPEEIVLAAWVYKNFSSGEVEKVVGGEDVEKKSLEKLVKVGIWCIQDEPTLRPSIKSVVMMLEGRTEIAVPPCPTSSFT